MTEAEVEKTANGTSTVSTSPKDNQVTDPMLNKESGDAASSKQHVEDDKPKLDVNENGKAVVKDESSKSPDEKDEAVAKQDESTKEDQDTKTDDNLRRGPYRRYRTGGRFGGSRFRITPEEEQRRWEDQQKKKTVLQQSVTGKVKWYSFRKNYGFIQRDDDQQDVFVHQLAISKSRIRKPNLRTLGHGETVQFDVVQGKKGLEASNVTGPDGTEVQGSRIIFVFTDTYDRFNRRRLPYYSDYNRRPAYYDNYRRPAYRNRDVYRPRDDHVGNRYDGSRSRYPANRDRSYPINRNRSYPTNRDRSYPGNRRDRSAYRDEKFERPYRQNVYRGRRRSYNPEQQQKLKDEKVEVKEATDPENKNEIKNKNGYRRVPRVGRQFRRRFYKNRKNQGATSAHSDTSVKEISATQTSDENMKDKQQNIPEDIVKGVGAIEVK